MVSNALSILKDGALDLLFPPRCAYCGSTGAIDPASCLCPICLNAEEVFDDDERLCRRCSLPIEHPADSVGTSACRRCEHVSYRFQYAASAGRYEGRLRSLIIGYKYEAKLQAMEHLAELLSRAYGRSAFYDKVETVSFVPPSMSRMKHRGFDPVEELARTFADAEGFTYIEDVIRRVRDTRPLAGLNAKERRSEILGAFGPAGEKRIDGVDLILVDDIMTTGSTLNDAARALKKAGAGKIYALTVARDLV